MATDTDYIDFAAFGQRNYVLFFPVFGRPENNFSYKKNLAGNRHWLSHHFPCLDIYRRAFAVFGIPGEYLRQMVAVPKVGLFSEEKNEFLIMGLTKRKKGISEPKRSPIFINFSRDN